MGQVRRGVGRPVEVALHLGTRPAMTGSPNEESKCNEEEAALD